MLNSFDAWIALERVREFTVTDEHLRLLRRANIDWIGDEYGAPGLNHKRPYGNSNVYRDMAEIVDGEFMNAMGEGAKDDYIQANEGRWDRLHAEAGIALQIALETQTFEAGRYVRGPMRWRKVSSD